MFGGRALPGPAGGAYSAPPDLLAGLNGPYFYGGGRMERGRGEEGGGWKERGRKGGRGGRGRPT